MSEGAMSATASAAEAFLMAFRHHPSGVAIITADCGEGPVALTVSSLISVSVNPPTIAFSLSETSTAAQSVLRAETVVVHFVRRADMQLARLCATSGADRFGANVRWARLATGEPYYPEVALWFRAIIRGKLAVPAACIATAELLEASECAREPEAGETLVYANRTWHGLRPISDSVKAPLLLWPDDSATF
jgi:flavin reductase (DIM6/NTAB) family NADH-FMN oxidoreductase RutF